MSFYLTWFGTNTNVIKLLVAVFAIGSFDFNGV